MTVAMRRNFYIAKVRSVALFGTEISLAPENI